MWNKIFNFKSPSPQFQNITKDILGICVPKNATTFAKVAAAGIVKKKMKELFEKEIAVVLSKSENIDEIKQFLLKNDIKFQINTFKGKWNDFDEKSLSICFENVSFKEAKNLAIQIVKNFNQKVILKDSYNIYLIS